MIIVRRRAPGTTAHEIAIRAHEIVADMSVADGGADAGPTPHDLYDAALGACKALTILWYAARKGVPVEDITVSVVRDDMREAKGVYRLATTVALTGDLTDDQRARLLDVAAKCPVQRLMTQVTTEIETHAADPAGRVD